jgi:hypothetical protein
VASRVAAWTYFFVGLDGSAVMCDARGMNKKLIVIIDAIIVVAFLIVAVIYFTHAEGRLPHWFPGYKAGSSAKHIKHGLAAVIIALGVGAFGWFATGPKEFDHADSKASHHHDSVPKQ